MLCRDKKTANYCEQLFTDPLLGLWMLLERRDLADPMWLLGPDSISSDFRTSAENFSFKVTVNKWLCV